MNAMKPNEIANLKIWLKAESINVLENEPIIKWNAEEGTNIFASGAGRPPTLKYLDNKKYVYFNATVGQRMDLSQNIFNNNNDMTLFVKVLPLNDGHILGLSTSSNPYYPYLKGLTTTNGKYGASARSNGAGTLIETNHTDYLNKKELVTVVFKNNSSYIQTSTEKVENKTNVLNYYPYTRLTIGASDGSKTNSYIQPFSGYIEEILVYDRVLSDEEVSKVRNYVNENTKMLLNDGNEYYYYNEENSLWTSLGSSINKVMFDKYANSSIGIEIRDFINTYGDIFKVCAINDKLEYATLNATPFSQIVKPKGDVNLLGVKSINSIMVNAIGAVKIAISIDSGHSWIAFKNGVWENVQDTSDGMLYSDLNALTTPDLRDLLTDNKIIRFSYCLEYGSEVNDISMKVDLDGHEALANKSDYDYTYNIETKTLTYTINKNGTYTVTYIDGN